MYMSTETKTTARKPRPIGWTTTITGRKVALCDGTPAHCDAIHAAYGNHFCKVTEPSNTDTIVGWVREQTA